MNLAQDCWAAVLASPKPRRDLGVTAHKPLITCWRERLFIEGKDTAGSEQVWCKRWLINMAVDSIRPCHPNTCCQSTASLSSAPQGQPGVLRCLSWLWSVTTHLYSISCFQRAWKYVFFFLNYESMITHLQEPWKIQSKVTYHSTICDNYFLKAIN